VEPLSGAARRVRQHPGFEVIQGWQIPSSIQDGIDLLQRTTGSVLITVEAGEAG
jgi:hypothetical protein